MSPLPARELLNRAPPRPASGGSFLLDCFQQDASSSHSQPRGTAQLYMLEGRKAGEVFTRQPYGYGMVELWSRFIALQCTAVYTYTVE